ncbi:hypothetical protein HKBW3S42_01762, partial [Candidatus Hakubella thermalkaliphila]
LFFGQSDQFSRLPGVHGQRLFGKNRLASLDSRLVYLEMKMVGGYSYELCLGWDR